MQEKAAQQLVSSKKLSFTSEIAVVTSTDTSLPIKSQQTIIADRDPMGVVVVQARVPVHQMARRLRIDNPRSFRRNWLKSSKLIRRS